MKKKKRRIVEGSLYPNRMEQERKVVEKMEEITKQQMEKMKYQNHQDQEQKAVEKMEKITARKSYENSTLVITKLF